MVEGKELEYTMNALPVEPEPLIQPAAERVL